MAAKVSKDESSLISIKDILEARVCILDDNPTNIDILTEQLSKNSFNNFNSFTSPHAALDHIRGNGFDLLLLDIKMPEMDGFEFMGHIKSEGLLTGPILILTASTERTVRVQAFEEGIKDFLTKPFDEHEIIARVHNLLEMHLARKILFDHNQILEQQIKQRINELDNANRELNSARLETIQRLSRAGEYKDNETGSHVIRMSHYSRLLARKIHLDEAQADLVFHAAPMHDIGKIGVPNRVLLKNGPLDSSELRIVRTHPAIGAEIIGHHETGLLRMAHEVSLTHHEKWNGEGYPQGLQGEEIPLVGRIVAIADVFDALTTRRPYKEPWSIEKTLAWMESESGGHFDPELLTHFFASMPEIYLIQKKYSTQD